MRRKERKRNQWVGNWAATFSRRGSGQLIAAETPGKRRHGSGTFDPRANPSEIKKDRRSSMIKRPPMNNNEIRDTEYEYKEPNRGAILIVVIWIFGDPDAAGDLEHRSC